MAQSTENREYRNFYQISRLLTDVCTTTFKSKLEHVFLQSTFEDMLNRKRHELYHLRNNVKCCKCVNEDLCGGNIVLNESQWGTMFVATSTQCQDDSCSCCFSAVPGIKTDILDLKLSLYLLLHIARLSPDDRNNITSIDTARLHLNNSNEAGKLSDTDFEDLRKDVSEAVRKLAFTCSTTIGEKVEYDIETLFSEQVSSSIETENFYRLVTLVTDYGSAALRDKIKDTFDGYSFESILNNNKHAIYHLWKKEKCCACGPGYSQQKRTLILEFQWNKLFKSSGTQCSRNCCCCYVAQPNYSFNDLDVTLASCLLQNIAGLTPAEMKHLTEIRNTRNNVISHIPHGKLTDSDFEANWTSVTGHILKLTRTCTKKLSVKPQYVKMVEDNIERLKTGLLDISFVENTIRLLKEAKMDLELMREITQYTTAVQNLLTESTDNTKMAQELKTQMMDLKDMVQDLILEAKTKDTANMMRDLRAQIQDTTSMVLGLKAQITANTDMLQDLKAQTKYNTNMVRDAKDKTNDYTNIVQDLNVKITHDTKIIEEMMTDVKENTKTLHQMERSIEKIEQTPNVHDDNLICPRLKYLMDRTKSRLEKSKPNYITMKRLEELAFKCLCDDEEKEKDTTDMTVATSNVVILTGEPGTGKTSTGEQILRTLSKLKQNTLGYVPIILDHPEDVRLVAEYEQPVAVLIDDPFGDYPKLEHWERYFQDIEVQADRGRFKFIMCLRKQTLSESKDITEKYQLFHTENIVDLSSKDNKLTSTEKRHMINQYRKLNDVTFCKERWKQDLPKKVIALETINNIAGADPMLGFQQTCHLFFTHPQYFCQGVDFFTRASEKLKLEIDKLRSTEPLQYCILAYVLLKGGSIDILNIDQSMFATLFGVVGAETKLSRDIKHCVIHYMAKRYLIRSSGEVFEFKHETILEAILVSFGNDFSEEFLKLGAREIIIRYARSHCYESKPGEICVTLPNSVHVQLADYLTSHYGMAYIARHQTTDDKMFIPVLLESIDKCQQQHMYRGSLLVQGSIKKADDFSSLERKDERNIAVISAVKHERANLVTEMLKRYMHSKERTDKTDSSNSQIGGTQVLAVSTYIHALNYLCENKLENGEQVMEAVGFSLESALKHLQHEIKTKLKYTNIGLYAAYCEWRFVLLQLDISLFDTTFCDPDGKSLMNYCSKLGWKDVMEKLSTSENDSLNEKTSNEENPISVVTPRLNE